MSEKQGKFVWYELMTTDTAGAADFYGSVVGWTAKDAGMEGMAYTLFSIPEAPMGLAGMMTLPDELKQMNVPPHWNGYVNVDDVDASAKAFADNGGQVLREPSDIPGIGRFAVVADPQGAVINLFKPAPMDAEPPPPPAAGTKGTIAWHELYTSDSAAALDFYNKMFGWTRDREMDMGEMGVYRIFAHDGVAIGGMMTKSADMPMSAWGYYFDVEALGAAVERVKTGGGQVVNGPMKVPEGPWIAQCLDPQGAFFALASMAE